MSRRQQVIEQARRIFGSFEAAAEALGVAPPVSDGLESIESPGGAMEAVQAALESITGPSRTEEAQAPVRDVLKQQAQVSVSTGLDAMKKVEVGDDGEISLKDQQGLESIILLAGRPAILIQDGDFMNPPKLWTQLKDVRAQINEVVRRVGRIEVSKHPNFEWIGTGWLAGNGIVITNRHVALEFSKQSAKGDWAFRSPISASVNLRAELNSEDVLSFAVTRIVGIHEDHDLAVLQVEQASGAEALPDPLPLATKPPSTLVGNKVYVVGYPAWDGRRNDPEPMKRIFADIYNVKRLQPGEISGAAVASFEVFHDCSTLGGNSGSPVIDLETHRVLGLHFGGRFLEANHAVPMWTLQNDPLIKRANLNFQ